MARLGDFPPLDVRGPFVVQRGWLLRLLSSLSDDKWAADTAAPGWSVKDLSLHLLFVDLSWLSRGRDQDHSGTIDVSAGHEAFVNALADRNEQWVAGARILSPEVIVHLLDWAGGELTSYLDGIDLAAPSSVYWAGDVPMWFDMAREFTERWVHGRQIREAALGQGGHGAQGGHFAQGGQVPSDSEDDQFLGLVIHTFIWAYPHQYRAEATPGTTVAIEVEGVGGWTLTAQSDGWDLDEGLNADPVASLTMTADAAWRLLTGARYEESQVRLAGRADLAEPLTKVRGIIV